MVQNKVYLLILIAVFGFTLCLPGLAITQQEYMDKVYDIVRKNINEIQYPYPFEVRYSYSMLNNSKLYGVKIIKSSGNKEIDKQVIQKIWTSKNLPPFPKEFLTKYPKLQGLQQTATFVRTITSTPIESEEENYNKNIESDSSENNLLDRITKIETFLGIKTSTQGILQRLDAIEIALLGNIKNGNLLNRLQNIENSINNKKADIIPPETKIAPSNSSFIPQAQYNTTSSQLAPIQLGVDNQASPQINNKQYNQKPLNLAYNVEFIPKNPNNPMNWNYNPSFGSYLGLIYLENTKYKNTGFPKFQKFPVKYWIQPMNAAMQQPIRTAITEYSYYFPMEEVGSRGKANLTFEAVSYSTLQQVCKTARTTHALACGGPSITREKIYEMEAITNYKASVWIDIESFRIKNLFNTVLHEMGHAFGSTEHSNDPRDVMFEISKLQYNNKGELIQIDESGKLTPRDLNTLFLIYNQKF